MSRNKLIFILIYIVSALILIFSFKYRQMEKNKTLKAVEEYIEELSGCDASY